MMVWSASLVGALLLLAFAGAAYAQGGRGGWWTRVTPTTPEQKALVAEVQKLHTQLWQKVGELRALQAEPEPSEERLDAKQSEIDGLRDKLVALNTKSRALIQQMLPQAGWGAGAATGTCPFGGPGAGAGRWRGAGRGAGRGLGGGRGMGYGCGMGGGWGCPWR